MSHTAAQETAALPKATQPEKQSTEIREIIPVAHMTSALPVALHTMTATAKNADILTSTRDGLEKIFKKS